MADAYTPQDAFGYLTDQGYAPHHAAALVGNMMQESSMNPNALNQGEGAYGLMQWRLDRRQGLEDFARAQGAAPNDPTTQLNYIRQEMGGPESKAGNAFLAAPDVASANAALKGYIRYGDDSQATRLSNANAVLGGAALPGAAAGPAGGAPTAPAGILGAAPAAVPAGPVGLLAGLKATPASDVDVAGLLAKLTPAANTAPQLQVPAPLVPIGRRFAMAGLRGRR